MPPGQRIGYVRVSSVDQNPERQLSEIPLDQVFEDRVSGHSADRPQLAALLRYVRAGDTVIVHSMDRLARNLDDLRHLVRHLTDRQVTVQFVKEGLTFTGEDTPMATLLLSVLGAFAEFERALIRERQREGIALAKQRGVYKGRQWALGPQRAAELRRRAEAGVPKAVLACEFGVSRATVYRYLRGGPPGDGPPRGAAGRRTSPAPDGASQADTLGRGDPRPRRTEGQTPEQRPAL